MHEETEYPVGPNQTYIRHLTIVWVDDGLENLQCHTYLAWFHPVGLESTWPIRDFEGLQHDSEDVVNWESWDKYAPNGEVTDLDDPPENPGPEPEPEHEEKPMESEHEDELIEINSDT
ncbi:hypothetical protein NL676_028089 [Syzygium grande]|nr:hypothetical protein NL676_028089 [Syzygium grande]